METIQSLIAVIEPHADDAFLSLGSTLAAWDGPKLIVTVLHDKRRGEEAAEYAYSIGAEWLGLGYAETHIGLRAPLPPDSPASLLTTADITAGIPPRALQVWPLGIQHPEHRIIAALAPGDVFRYSDLPYATKRKNAVELVERTVARRLLSEREGEDRYGGRHIFRSQGTFFFYERDRLRSPVEQLWSGV